MDRECIFSKDIVNSGRQTEMDLLRGFISITLIIVHVGLFLGNNISRGLWTFCDIIGSEPIAPVYMVLMGISISYSRHNDPRSLLKRGIRFFAFGYALSAFRSLIPFLVFGNIDEWASAAAFFVVDILQFAGLTCIAFSILRKLNVPSIVIFAVSLVMVVIDQFIMLPETIGWESETVTGIVNLFCPVTEWSCFPFLTWFSFPAFGLLFGNLLTHCNNKKKLYCILLPAGLAGVLYVYLQFHFLYPDYTSYYWGNNFYYMGLKNVILTLFFVFFALSFWFFAGKITPEPVKKLFSFLSRNINRYYIWSWILISPLIHLQAIYNWEFDTFTTIIVMAALTIACLFITKLWLIVRKALFQKIRKNSI